MLINLHSHLPGWVRAATAAELAAADGTPEPDGGWAEAFRLAKPADLTTFLQRVGRSAQFFSSVPRIRRLALEAVLDAAAGGLDYLELRFGPASYLSDTLDLDAIVSAVAEGCTEGTRLSGLEVGLVVVALRHHSDDAVMAVANAAARWAGRGVVGFDLAGDEFLFPDLSRYSKAFQVAGAAGLGLTCHAAEAGPADAGRQAARLLGVSRIGHGVRVADSPEDLEWLAETGIVIECCPYSNWYTGAIGSLSEHPLRKFEKSGIGVVLGDDDPMVTGRQLADETDALRQHLGLDDTDLARIAATSIKAGFMAESTRSELRAGLTKGR